MTTIQAAEGFASEAMGTTVGTQNRRRGQVDVLLLAATGLLVLAGLVAVYSGSAFRAASHTGGDDLLYVRQQVMGAVLGVGAMLLLMRFDYRMYNRLATPALFGTCGLLVLTLLVGRELNGATRWLFIGGVSFQPAELAKIVIALFMARSMAKMERRTEDVWELYGHLIPLIMLVLPLMLQPDFGSSLIICTVASAALFVGGAQYRHLIPAGMAILVFGIAAIFTGGYRMARVMTWFQPWEDPDGSGFQLINAWVALARGGLQGTGFGQGFGGFGYVPELYNDFVAAVIGEEFGLLGMVALCALYGVFLWRGYTIAFRAVDRFGQYLAFNLTTLLGLQAFINLGVLTGLLPTKGLTLPLVSYGRTSLIITLAVVGILLNISQRNPDLAGERRLREQQERERRELEARRTVRDAERLEVLKGQVVDHG